MKLVARITDDWLPLPDALLNRLQWKDGDRVAIEIIDDTVLITRETDEETTARPGAGRGTVRRK